MASARALVDDAVEEILLRLPPDDPASLLRASLACKPWCRLLTSAAFLRRYRRFHRTPPMLGFLRNDAEEYTSRFVPTASFRTLDPDRRDCSPLDCRHGRVLIYDFASLESHQLLLWVPITGEERQIPLPVMPRLRYDFIAAVLCAVSDCDHLDCQGGPFLVAAVGVSKYTLEPCACVYSSEAAEWSEPITMDVEPGFLMEIFPNSVLAGDAMYFICKLGTVILRYDLHGEGSLSAIKQPDVDADVEETSYALVAVDGGVTFAVLMDHRLHLWSLETMDPDGVAGWSQLRVIQLETLLPAIADPESSPRLVGFAKEADSDVIFVGTKFGLFAVGLTSHWIRKVCDGAIEDWTIFPYMSFFTPVLSCCGNIVDAGENLVSYGLLDDGAWGDPLA
ncbi:hypothetical protein ACP70R_048364 [Stipagrostis hirtigluma subsp. patula]